MSEEWGPWIEHDGHGCPCVGQYGMAEFDEGRPKILEGVIYGFPNAWRFDLPRVYGAWGKAIRYRIRKPRGMTILENLIADLPAPSLEPSPINETAPREGLPA